MKSDLAVADRIAWTRVSSCYLPLANPISDAKVPTGRKKPMTAIAMLFTEIETKDRHKGLGFSCSKRAGGPDHRCLRRRALRLEGAPRRPVVFEITGLTV